MGEEMNLSQWKLYMDGQEIGGIESINIKLANEEENKDYKQYSLPFEGTIKFDVRKSPTYIKFKRLFKYLKHTKKFRTKKKLFNRTYNECGFYLWVVK
mgnify:CR=1 FL=1